MKKVVLDQRSPAWLAWRKEGIGGSEIAVLVAYAPLLLADAKKRGHAIAQKEQEILAAFSPLGLTSVYTETPRKLWALKIGRGQEKRVTPHMLRGVRFEDLVRAAVEKKVGQKAEPLCAEHDVFPHFRVSFDGILTDGRPLEIKCPSATVFADIKTGGIPPYYYPQVQYQTVIAAAPSAMFVAALIDETAGKIDDVHQEDIPLNMPFVRAMLEVADFFWTAYVEQEEEPPLVEGLDVVVREDPEWAAAAMAYLAEKAKMDALAEQVAAGKTRLEATTDALVALMSDHAKAAGAGVSVTRFHKQGSVSYQRALAHHLPALSPADLDAFRGKGSDEVRVSVAKATASPGMLSPVEAVVI